MSSCHSYAPLNLIGRSNFQNPDVIKAGDMGWGDRMAPLLAGTPHACDDGTLPFRSVELAPNHALTVKA